MKKLLLLLFAAAFALSITGCWTATMSDMPVDVKVSPESVEDPWGITLSAEDVTAEGLTLVCTQSGGNPTGELQTGTPFWLEVSTDDGWIPFPYVDPETEIAWTMQAFLIPKNDRTEWNIGWSYLYGTLQPGTYRIGKTITDFRGPGDYDDCSYYATFTISEA